MLNISGSSTVRLKVPIVSNLDPTNDRVDFAFVPRFQVLNANTVWTQGQWDTTDTPLGGANATAMLLIGPNGNLALDPGQYVVWVRITDNPEIPVLESGLIAIYS